MRYVVCEEPALTPGFGDAEGVRCGRWEREPASIPAAKHRL